MSSEWESRNFSPRRYNLFNNKIEDSKFTCLGCRYVRYCCKECQEQSIDIHQPECHVIGKRPLRTMTRMILRILNKTNAVNQKLKRGIILTIEELIRIYGKILINSFAITDQNSGSVIGRALYLGASIFDHSCCPDLYYQFDGLKIYFIASRDIILRVSNMIEEISDTNDEDGAQDVNQLYISYIDEILPVWERQRILKSGYYFECRCTRCQDDLQRLPSINNEPRLSQCLEMIEDYFESDHCYELIQMAVDYFKYNETHPNFLIPDDILHRKYLIQTNPELFSIKQRIEALIQHHRQQKEYSSHQMLLEQCRLILTNGCALDLATILRIKDFISCHECDSEELEQILQIYSQYYGNHKHPRILRRIWFWLGILLLDKFSSPQSSKIIEKSIINSNILLSLHRRTKLIKSYLRFKFKFNFPSTYIQLPKRRIFCCAHDKHEIKWPQSNKTQSIVRSQQSQQSGNCFR
ncbi:hypothetical protein DERF_007426 [Dermatophagoides farinae]|uniref:MYND-type domain-containing protein n=1 Tax=Dermatophagoides farinae TaxID=6954 RepID=A0A922L4H1_DERFA|nr:hypothetical protein DERF_007426 [Dermatophagoides farinae]